MKLFKYSLGSIERLGAAEDAEDAYDRRAEVDPTFSYLPMAIEEIKVEGFTVTVTPESEEVVRNKGGRPRKVEV